ncbi:MAG: uracil-DNA glycosylase [Bacteroidota bacterium]
MKRSDSLLDRIIDRLEFESAIAPDFPTTVAQPESGAETSPSGSTPAPKRPDTCRTLDELETLCRESDELRTDLDGTQLVFGSGDPNARIMIIGEAPGEEEDRQGVPFVGAAGELLTKILQAIHLDRDDVYIANILKHRPPGNRNPNEEERQRSLPFLLRQIELVDPILILSLGRVASTTLLETDTSLSSLRGQFHPFGERELLATYHPAALLRNPAWKRPVWEDVQRLQKRLDERTATK